MWDGWTGGELWNWTEGMGRVHSSLLESGRQGITKGLERLLPGQIDQNTKPALSALDGPGSDAAHKESHREQEDQYQRQ